MRDKPPICPVHRQAMRLNCVCFRCPVIQCARVESLDRRDIDSVNDVHYIPPDPPAEVRKCPRCGEPTDASPARQRLSDFRCLDCRREYHNEYYVANRQRFKRKTAVASR